MTSRPDRSMKTQITLQDIANKAEVSRATVSLALRNHPSLPVTTRQRIQQVAGQLGYRPNPLVSTLMSYQRAARSDRPTNLTLALLLKFSRRGSWQQYLSPDLISGAAERAGQLGYRLEEFWLDDLKMDGKRLSQILFQRGVPGVILAPMPAAVGHFDLDWAKLSAVTIGYSLARPELHRVTSDRYHAMLLAVHELRKRGYRRLGLALESNQDERVHHQWVAPFLWEQMHGKPTDRVPLLIVKGEEWNEQRFEAWFRENSPEVILGYDPQIIAWLERLGRRVPRDVGFAHLWNPDQSGKLAGLYHNPPGIGASAVDFLVAMIHTNDRGVPQSPRVMQLEASWADGKTIKTRKKIASGRRSGVLGVKVPRA